jgi:simple sugar transport system permease protein
MEDVATLGFIATTIGATWRLATPLIFAAIGEVFSERAGVLNIGLEGVMLVGAFVGFATMFTYGSLPLGLASAIAAGMVVGLLFAFFTITIKADQIVVGAAINLLGMGLTAFLFRTYFVGTGRGWRSRSRSTFPVSATCRSSARRSFVTTRSSTARCWWCCLRWWCCTKHRSA